jgi:excinuclease UvrABC ATPase subunit
LLINNTLHPVASTALNGATTLVAAPYASIEGLDQLDKVVDIDQSPIGRTPRSNPATYTGIFTPVRELFSGTQEARSRGYNPGRFSFNVKGGRCEACQGDGMVKVEMHFLPDVYVACDVCLSKRDTGQTLYILDEPTTGLHFEDIRQLLAVLHQLRDQGNTIVVIEHNLDVIKTADWIVDLGPEGGSGGGIIVAEGTPETVAACEGSFTGFYLKRMLCH